MLVFVVTKNTLVLLRIAIGEAFRAGCAIGVRGAVHLPYRSGSRPFYRKMAAGAKAQFSFRLLRPD
jgi:hypothetical protein